MSVSPSKILRNLLRDEAFYFFTSIGNYTGQSAATLGEFMQKIRKIDARSLEFHLYREDFEKWIDQTLGDTVLAAEIRNLRSRKVAGNVLRGQLYNLVSRRYRALKGKPDFKAMT
ncbi:hypothetical protein GWN65_04460 [Candidatus Bathyarchaeota archaeon]|nr:hypothetical protein [Candidatus Bathyarchaeota archaeon]NIV44383.1 hypothetical protein [Candidatus Bathyarchaeota archaeon]